MPKFIYKAKKGPQNVIDGTIIADDEKNAIHQIIQSGAVPIDIAQETKGAKRSGNFLARRKGFRWPQLCKKRVKLIDIYLFTQQLSDLTEASVPVLRSLKVISQQTKKIHVKEIVDSMHRIVQDGGSLSDALSFHSSVFSKLYINIVKTGELSGQLDMVLIRLVDYLKKEMDARNRIKSSLAYPTLILAVGVLTIFVLLTFVIPRLTVMLEDLNQTLPLATYALMEISAFFSRYWPIMIVGGIAAWIAFQRWAKTVEGRFAVDRFKLSVPGFGRLIRIVEVGRFARTLATLVESGVDITSALQSVSQTIDNVALKNEIEMISEEVKNGSSIKSALGQCDYFPDMAVNMISVGEETGRLEYGLHKTADAFDRESDQMIKIITSLLGPAVLVVIVSIVGCAVLAMMLPIFRMNLLIQ